MDSTTVPQQLRGKHKQQKAPDISLGHNSHQKEGAKPLSRRQERTASIVYSLENTAARRQTISSLWRTTLPSRAAPECRPAPQRGAQRMVPFATPA